MQRSFLTRLSIITALCSAAAFSTGFAPAPLTAQADDGAAHRKVIETAGDALVTVKFVIKAPQEGMGDAEIEINGVVIDPKGLVLCSYLATGGSYGTPQDVRVLIGDDTEGKKAKILSHDSDLDLSWVKLDEDSTTPLKHVDLEKGATAKTGETVYLLSRLDKYFDRALVVNSGHIRGETQKPRHLFAPSRSILAERAELGMPVFNADVAVIGFAVVQIPDEESMQSGGVSGGPMILPIADVAKATKRALEAAANPAPTAPALPAGPVPGEPKKD